MHRILRTGVVTVVLVDVLAAVAHTSELGFHFGWRGPILIAIYAVAGFLAGRAASVRAAMTVGFVLGSVDAGIAMAWALSVGPLPDAYAAPILAEIVISIVGVAVLTGSLIGLLARSTVREAAA